MSELKRWKTITLKKAIKELGDWEHSGDERLGQAIRFVLAYIEATEYRKKRLAGKR